MRFTKIVQTEDKGKKNSLFLAFVEVQPILGVAKDSANQRQWQIKKQNTAIGLELNNHAKSLKCPATWRDCFLFGKDYFSLTVMLLPALWALNCGAYWHWMVAMPEVNSPGLVTHTS